MRLPPLHPAVVHFPIALVTFSVAAEFAGYFTGSATAAAVAWWSLVGALVGVTITVPLGYHDMWRARLAHRSHALVHVHLRVGWLLAVFVLALTFWRWRLQTGAGEGSPVGIPYLVAAALLLSLTLFQGWFGGEIAYSHGAGSAAAGQGLRSAEEAQRPAEAVARALSKLPLIHYEAGGKDKHGNASH